MECASSCWRMPAHPSAVDRHVSPRRAGAQRAGVLAAHRFMGAHAAPGPVNGPMRQGSFVIGCTRRRSESLVMGRQVGHCACAGRALEPESMPAEGKSEALVILQPRQTMSVGPLVSFEQAVGATAVTAAIAQTQASGHDDVRGRFAMN